MVNHTIIHFEIPAVDVKKLSNFYAKLFGWKIIKLVQRRIEGSRLVLWMKGYASPKWG
jgi:predicted enzyme related to lactoylglutathione lyase